MNCNEIEAAMLLSIHNINFLLKLTENIRTAIAEDRLGEFRENFYRDYYNKGVNCCFSGKNVYTVLQNFMR